MNIEDFVEREFVSNKARLDKTGNGIVNFKENSNFTIECLFSELSTTYVYIVRLNNKI